MTATSTTIEKAAENVAPNYVHHDKFVDPDENILFQNSSLKWYNLATTDDPVPVYIRDLARSFLETESAAGELETLGELGFVILHRCGGDFYFLLVSTWRNENELWESVYAKDGVDQAEFGLFTFSESHRATFCVWELAAVWHEQQVWKRYLLTVRDDKARQNYLRDRYRGPA